MQSGEGRRRTVTIGVRAGVALGLVLVLGAVGWTGCSRAPQIELPAPESGQYLTLEQQRALNAGQLKEYCRMLNDYLGQLRGDVELARSLQDSLTAVADSLQTEQIRLSTDARRLEREIAELKSNRGGPVIYVTKEGDTLVSLANLFYGSSVEWRRIYEANRGELSDPQQPLKAGMRLTIP